MNRNMRIRITRISTLLPVLLAAIFAAPFPVHATLGQDESTVDADRQHMRARRVPRIDAGYTVHELQLESGTIVQEYVSTEGKVFAVAWKGPMLPDLAQIMGEANYHTFLNDPDSRHVLRRFRSVQREGLVVHSGGRPRAFSGHAYVPALLPPGFSLDTLR
jgi:hypothetical protein